MNRLALQTITTTWTKSSRGGRLATLRSRIPKQLPLRLSAQFAPVYWHAIAYSEHNAFAAPFAERVATQCEDNRFGCANAEIDLHKDSATLRYRHHAGAPERQFFDKTGTPVPCEHAIEIPINRWASVEYNGRFSCIDSGDWWYEHVVINVAIAADISPSVFTAVEPIERYRQIAHLR